MSRISSFFSGVIVTLIVFGAIIYWVADNSEPDTKYEDLQRVNRELYRDIDMCNENAKELIKVSTQLKQALETEMFLNKELRERK
jgi:hypothetical protein